MNALKIPSFKTFKSWRHTFGFWAGDFVPIHKLKEIMGHHSIRTTEIYCRGDVEEFAKEIRKRASQA